MRTVEVSADVYLPADEVFDFLLEFPRYADYSRHLTGVTRRGDGGPGTEYDLRFQWWKLSYTARSRVTAVDRPSTIDWEVSKDIDAHGRWVVEPAPSRAPPDRATASRVRLVVNYRPDSVDGDIVNLPRFVPLSRVVSVVADVIVHEGERVVERVVADLEGEPRDVHLDVSTS